MDLLPKTVTVDGEEYDIRSDYRAILDICIALADPELEDSEKATVALCIFYPDAERLKTEQIGEAIERCFWFINGGGEEEGATSSPSPRLIDWEKDIHLIIPPINRVLGTEIRALDYLHWWTFLGAYYEIGDCLFSQVVRIRDKLARNRKMDKSEREWYRRNRKMVDLPKKLTSQEQEFLDLWLGKGGSKA